MIMKKYLFTFIAILVIGCGVVNSSRAASCLVLWAAKGFSMGANRYDIHPNLHCNSFVKTLIIEPTSNDPKAWFQKILQKNSMPACNAGNPYSAGKTCGSVASVKK
jgi:hypothetical protein